MCVMCVCVYGSQNFHIYISSVSGCRLNLVLMRTQKRGTQKSYPGWLVPDFCTASNSLVEKYNNPLRWNNPSDEWFAATLNPPQTKRTSGLISIWSTQHRYWNLLIKRQKWPEEANKISKIHESKHIFIAKVAVLTPFT